MTYGPMTLERERAFRRRGWTVRVYVRGEDVTRRCRFADDTPGAERAELFRQNAHGHYYPDEDHRPSIEIADAEVVIVVS